MGDAAESPRTLLEGSGGGPATRKRAITKSDAEERVCNRERKEGRGRMSEGDLAGGGWRVGACRGPQDETGGITDLVTHARDTATLLVKEGVTEGGSEGGEEGRGL